MQRRTPSSSARRMSANSWSMWLCTLPSESRPIKCSAAPVGTICAINVRQVSPRKSAPVAMAASTSFAP